MRVLDLFSGIGGFSLGLERAGFQTVAFCEIDPYCRRIIARHWPSVPCYDDVRTLTAEKLRADGISVDVICGGFPCQDISLAGKGAGIDGERSGLWSEYARIIDELRPRYVIVENVAALLGRGLDRVLGDLATLGYDAEWHCIPASAVGAPHRRDRVWIVAYPEGRSGSAMADFTSTRRREGQRSESGALWNEARRSEPQRRSNDVADPECSHGPSRRNGEKGEFAEARERQAAIVGGRSKHQDVLPDSVQPGLPQWDVAGSAGSLGSRIFAGGELERILATVGREQWGTEPDVGRVANGVPARVDRLRSLGNAVVPQIPEMIGRAIMSVAHNQN